MASAIGPCRSASDGVHMNPPPPISCRSSLQYGSHFGISPRRARNGRSSGYQTPPSSRADPASAATSAERVSSAMFQIWPSFSWMWSKRPTPVVFAIMWPRPNANESLT